MHVSDLVITIKSPTLGYDLERIGFTFGLAVSKRLEQGFVEENTAQIEAISNLSALWKLSFDDARTRFQKYVTCRPWDWRTCYRKIMAGDEDAVTSIPKF